MGVVFSLCGWNKWASQSAGGERRAQRRQTETGHQNEVRKQRGPKVEDEDNRLAGCVHSLSEHSRRGRWVPGPCLTPGDESGQDSKGPASGTHHLNGQPASIPTNNYQLQHATKDKGKEPGWSMRECGRGCGHVARLSGKASVRKWRYTKMEGWGGPAAWGRGEHSTGKKELKHKGSESL